MSKKWNLLSICVIGLLITTVMAAHHKPEKVGWWFNGTVIEACSCPVFCQCFFNTKPALHGGHDGHDGGEHFCRFNIAYKVNKGSHSGTDLAGATFWIAGDLGHDFSDMDAEWAIVTFDPSVSEAQRAGIAEILGKIYPLKWKSFSVAEDAKVVWSHNDAGAHATLGDGKIAEIVLNASSGMGGEPIVFQNVQYLGAPRNSGLIVMPNEIETYKIGENAFEFKGTTGFMTTVDIESADYE